MIRGSVSNKQRIPGLRCAGQGCDHRDRISIFSNRQTAIVIAIAGYRANGSIGCCCVDI